VVREENRANADRGEGKRDKTSWNCPKRLGEGVSIYRARRFEIGGKRNSII
jgi:hypothetical protein